jgi:Lrp/AsnC family leucine-responsive transcriptional regulator
MRRDQSDPAAVHADRRVVHSSSRNSPDDSPVGLDGIDWAILGELQRDGRVAVAELARRVGLGASSVGERVRRLEDTGVVRGYHARVDPERVGYSLMAFVRVRAASPRQGAFRAFVQDLPEIVECHHVTGEDCYLVKVLARSIHHLEETVAQLAGHGTTTTSIVFSTLVQGQVLERPAAPGT